MKHQLITMSETSFIPNMHREAGGMKVADLHLSLHASVENHYHFAQIYFTLCFQHLKHKIAKIALDLIV